MGPAGPGGTSDLELLWIYLGDAFGSRVSPRCAWASLPYGKKVHESPYQARVALRKGTILSIPHIRCPCAGMQGCISHSNSGVKVCLYLWLFPDDRDSVHLRRDGGPNFNQAKLFLQWVKGRQRSKWAIYLGSKGKKPLDNLHGPKTNVT